MAIFAAWLGVQKLTDSHETAKPDNQTISSAKWATLVYDGQTIGWIGDQAITKAASAKSIEVRYVSVNEDALNQMHMRPQVKAIGTPALILQSSDGHIVYMSKVGSIEDITAVLDKIPQPKGD